MAGSSEHRTVWDPFAQCESIARRNGSPLWQASRAFTPLKRQVFNATYASMRLIDDFVDEEFMALPADQRIASRPAALQRIDGWLKSIVDAKRGDAPPSFDRESSVFSALSQVLPLSGLAIAPWEAMARAMRRDIEEQPLPTWAAFLDYCEGATVAPAKVFIHILASRESEGKLVCDLPQPLGHYARDMAVFCYLVHIIRDLPKDARRTDQLLTVPADMLARHGLDGGRLESALSDGVPAQAVDLAAELAELACPYRDGANRSHAEMRTHLSSTDSQVLGALLKKYESVHDAVMQNGASVLALWAETPGTSDVAKPSDAVTD